MFVLRTAGQWICLCFIYSLSPITFALHLFFSLVLIVALGHLLLELRLVLLCGERRKGASRSELEETIETSSRGEMLSTAARCSIPIACRLHRAAQHSHEPR